MASLHERHAAQQDEIIKRLMERIDHMNEEVRLLNEENRKMTDELKQIQKTYEWISVKDMLPEDGEQVLVVKQLKDGRKSIDFGYYWSQYLVYDASAGANVEKPVWVTRGNNDVICWMPIPKAPEVSE